MCLRTVAGFNWGGNWTDFAMAIGKALWGSKWYEPHSHHKHHGMPLHHNCSGAAFACMMHEHKSAQVHVCRCIDACLHWRVHIYKRACAHTSSPSHLRTQTNVQTKPRKLQV